MTEPDNTSSKRAVQENGKTDSKSKEGDAEVERNSEKQATKSDCEVEEEEDEEEEVEIVTKNRKKQSALKDSKVTSKNEKIPLLDQPVIVEGSRNRRTVIQPVETKISVSKYSPIEIPDGEGTPLGQIPNINGRIKRLRLPVLKELHKLLFGKCGNPDNFIVNLQKFHGFPFEKDSDRFHRKLFQLNKFSAPDLKELVFSFDLDMKYKKKEEAARRVLDFLISPDISATEQTAQPVSHPRRKATKRNYEDADVDEVESPKKKKRPTVATKSSTEVTMPSKIQENSKTKSRRKRKNSTSENGKDTIDDTAQRSHESDANDDEMKKPAKKRKHHQVIEELEKDVKEGKNEKKRSSGREKSKKQEDEQCENVSEASTSEENENKKTDLTDEELKSFLQKVLANANLEETTMKTVYGLINNHYPDYNFSKKKDFIKEIVKSLLQSS